MKNSPDVRGSDSGGDQRFAGQLPQIGRHDALGLPEQRLDNGLGPVREPQPMSAQSVSVNDLDSLNEPVFPPYGWLDDSPSGSLADHPLLRGLLLELPAKGSVPTPGWLDRWFEAARSILELLYEQQAAGSQQRR